MDNDKLIERLPGDLRRFAEIVGLEGALRIAKEYGGTYIYIPKLDNLYREVRNSSIREEHDKGMTPRELSRKHNLTDRQIYNILGFEPPEDKTFTLPFSL